MKVLAPTYFKNFKCKCKECRNSCCKNWRIDVHADDIERLKNLKDSSIDSFIVIDKKETNDGFIQKDSNRCCPFIDTDGLCKIQKKYGEQALPRVCVNYPRNIFKDGGYNHLAVSNGCEKTIELLLNLDKFDIETIDYDFRQNKVNNIDSGLEQEQQQLINLLNDDKYRLSDIITNCFCSQITSTNTNSNFSVVRCFNFLHSLSYCLAQKKKVLAEYHNTLVKQLMSKDISLVLNKYIEAKVKFENNFPNNERFLRNLLCNYIFYTNLFAKTTIDKSQEYIKLCFVYIIIKFVTTLNFSEINDKNKYIDCIVQYFRALQNGKQILNLIPILKESGLQEQLFLAIVIKLLDSNK